MYGTLPHFVAERAKHKVALATTQLIQAGVRCNNAKVQIK